MSYTFKEVKDILERNYKTILSIEKFGKRKTRIVFGNSKKETGRYQKKCSCNCSIILDRKQE